MLVWFVLHLHQVSSIRPLSNRKRNHRGNRNLLKRRLLHSEQLLEFHPY